jgi:flagellar basal-body rod protein FlgF
LALLRWNPQMNLGLYQSAASLSSLERWQDAVAQNITSSQVAGFKKRTVEFSGLPMGEMLADPKGKIGRGEGPQAIFPKATYGINFQSGETHPTKRDLDIAIEGEGFFEVQLPDGGRGFTRAGELHIRADRTLVTGGEHPILSESGSPIALSAQGGDVTIAQDGTITQGNAQLGRIGVVKFQDLSRLTPIAGGVFVAPVGTNPTAVANPLVLQGHIEGSNVTPLREMIALVQIARAYEANQKIISSQDQTLNRALETLG